MKIVKIVTIAICMVFLETFIFCSPLTREELEARVAKLEAQLKVQQEELAVLKSALEAMKGEETKPSVAENRVEGNQSVKKEANIIRESTKKSLLGFKVSGDYKVRYETFSFDSQKPNRNRFRMRLRLGLSKYLGHGATFHFRVASGQTRIENGEDLGSPPYSTVQGFTDSFSEKPLWIDQAYISWKPDQIKGLTLYFGKSKNPFTHSQLVWDNDVSPEGFFERFQPIKGAISPFLTLGQAIIKENKSGGDSYMFGWQGGSNFNFGGVKSTFSLSYYDYHRYAENYLYTNGNTFTVLPDGRKVLDAGDFNILDVLGKTRFHASFLPITVVIDYAKNLGENAQGEHAGLDTAWWASAQLGENKKQGDISLEYIYTKVEANSVIGAFSYSNLGFADHEGSEIHTAYSLYDNVQLSTRLFLLRRLTYHSPWKRFIIDLIYKF